MNRENKANREIRNAAPGFIPCGDALEKMTDAILGDDELENVSGGMNMDYYDPSSGKCIKCNCKAYQEIEGKNCYMVCTSCGHKELVAIVC